jgi:hypothetical protein
MQASPFHLIGTVLVFTKEDGIIALNIWLRTVYFLPLALSLSLPKVGKI